MDARKKGSQLESREAIPVGRGERNEAGEVPGAERRGRSRAEFLPTICRYCGGIIRLVPSEAVYGASAERLGKQGEKIFQCQNCGARVGCHKGTGRPLGNVANEILRLKRIEAHQVFDSLWKSRNMDRTAAYRWLAKELGLPMRTAHIGGLEMDQCQRVIDLCKEERQKEAA